MEREAGWNHPGNTDRASPDRTSLVVNCCCRRGFRPGLSVSTINGGNQTDVEELIKKKKRSDRGFRSIRGTQGGSLNTSGWITSNRNVLRVQHGSVLQFCQQEMSWRGINRGQIPWREFVTPNRRNKCLYFLLKSTFHHRAVMAATAGTYIFGFQS